MRIFCHCSGGIDNPRLIFPPTQVNLQVGNSSVLLRNRLGYNIPLILDFQIVWKDLPTLWTTWDQSKVINTDVKSGLMKENWRCPNWRCCAISYFSELFILRPNNGVKFHYHITRACHSTQPDTKLMMMKSSSTMMMGWNFSNPF